MSDPRDVPAPAPLALRLAPRAALGGAMLAFAAALTALLSVKSRALMPEWPFDLTYFHDLVWNVAHGHGYRQSASYHELPGILNETHFEPIILLAVPPYWLWPRIETLFALQSALLALGAWGVYRLARSGGAGPWAATGIGAGYLLWWPLIRMAMADVRPLTWSVPLLLLLMAALAEARRREAVAWALLLGLCREELPVVVAFSALSTLLPRPSAAPRAQRRFVLALATGALLFLALLSALRPQASFYIHPLDWMRGDDGAGGGGEWRTSAIGLLPTRLAWLGTWLLPAGIGAVLAPAALSGALPVLGYLFTQPHEWATWDGPYVHHAAPALGLCAAAAARGWGRAAGWLGERGARSRAAGAALLALVLCAEALLLRARWEPYVLPELRPWLDGEERVLQAHRLAAQVPKDAAVMADWDTVHLFSGRRWVYAYPQEEPEPVDPGPAGLQGGKLLPKADRQPDWALLRQDDAPWMARSRAAGLREIDRGGDWALLALPDRAGTAPGPPRGP